MATTGIIILGNSGAGKSFLANVILGEEAFKHETRMNACTLTTEYRAARIGDKQYAVYNIPGLIEADQDRINLNIREIDAAFIGHPTAVIVFVLGVGNGGRIGNEDIVAFNAINKAYRFDEKSIIFVINQLDKDKVNDYKSSAKEKLNKLLNLTVRHLCVVPKIGASSSNEKKAIQSELLAAIKLVPAKMHKKEQDITLLLTELSGLKNQIVELQKKFEDEKAKDRLKLQQKEHQLQLERKEHQLELEREKTRRMMETMHIRDSSTSVYGPGFAPTPCEPRPSYAPPVFDISRFPTGSRPLKADGTPDLRFKINSIFK
ncbi:unnamed protein product [Rotaria magnacalcarata]|uniref:AIG1-type G domain-containing protein n=10 Tax=Rotaria TaxID=231623 RepID=A0A819KWM0_9BILA|nr:unnamed protein product [Rotaria magnacalcarata]CAF3562398.1 unnamed protein product [Rotaria socialis]CAF2152520.1 unnamed protein product [Rotaria magnacalcarata]CAF2232817.1 unnamed protein product [Rotaria magnacalcarata]CAF3952934.1 unnamed protein product [Rotaria magnacalcarata]